MNRTLEIVDTLKKIIPNPSCELNFNNDYELICAVMLSAQTTDKAVNNITPILFAKYPDFNELSIAEISEVERIIHPLGLSKVKSKNLIEIASIIKEKYQGLLPKEYEKLVLLPGVGRKTANVVLALAFGIPRIAVDTHVKRIAIKLKISNVDSSELDVEKNMMKQIPEKLWIEAHHLFLLFGRYYCTAKRPKCEECELKKFCRDY